MNLIEKIKSFPTEQVEDILKTFNGIKNKSALVNVLELFEQLDLKPLKEENKKPSFNDFENSQIATEIAIPILRKKPQE